MSTKLKVLGGQIPHGRIKVSGAKNAATRLMAAALLTSEKIVLSNFPTELVDVRHKGRFISAIGGQVEYDPEDDKLSICAGTISSDELDDYNYPIRTTYLLAAGQLVRNGIARIPYPGGCKLGERKYDLHILVWEKLGCKVFEKENYIEIVVGEGGLKGNAINFPITTIGGTENALLCSSVSKGSTIIRNAYISPEVANLVNLLQLMGARIKIEGGSMVTIEGVESLHSATIEVIPDRIEALTWIIYIALSGGSAVIEDVPFEQMVIPLKHLSESGLDYFHNRTSVYVSPECFSSHFVQPFELACGTHPGIISDMQPFYVLLAMKGAGKSLIVDYRYPKRTKYLEELNKFALGSLDWDSEGAAMIKVNGPVQLKAAEVYSTDLRGSMTLVMAALLAEGPSVVHNVDMALRGYNNMEKKLRSLGIEFSLSKE